MQHTDVVVAGAGTVGMSLALELRRRGRRVTLVERAAAGAGASSAAAGMLAVHDKANPPALQPLSSLSEELYPGFLDRLARLAPGTRVPFQTGWTLEHSDLPTNAPVPHGVDEQRGPFQLLREYSIDPRQLVAALSAACRKSAVRLLHATTLRNVEALSNQSLRVDTSGGPIACAQFVDCTGAWSNLGVRPVKGQMLRVRLDGTTPHLPGYGNVVLRTPSIYLVPRLDGSAVIGATLEEKGFCLKTKDATIGDLRARAAALYPAVADAPELERWAGLRPASVDCLPVLGPLPESRAGTCFVASGHFRNGILLAPATALVMGQLLCGERPDVGLESYAPSRFAAAPTR